MGNIKKYKDYIYLYETHLHTREGSACAASSGWEMAKSAKEYGYSGIFVTDHNWGGNTAVSRELPWDRWVETFSKGYYEALRFGQDNDLTVIFGYEAGYNATEFLIYGVTPDWLLKHPEIKDASIEEQYRLISDAGGMVVHAHPYREEDYIPEIRLFPELVDAVEGINATHSNSRSKSHNDPAFDERAIHYARQHGLRMVAGSDVHRTDMLGGGVLFKRKIKDVSDYINMIKTGDYYLTNGEKIFNADGELITDYERDGNLNGLDK